MFQFIKKTKFNFWILISGFVILAMLFSLSPAQPVLADVVSPEVGEDGTVTFRYEDPDANLVQLAIEHGRNDLGAMCYGSVPGFTGWPVYDMEQDAIGVWNFTLQLEPNVYNYHFVVDGVNVIDPMNPTWHPDANNGQVYVPGYFYEWVSVQDVPHGELRIETYYSDIADDSFEYTVYLPPNYDKNNRTYPTLYLSHGGGGNHIDWSTQGVANNILDNLIAEHKIRPAIVVMPNANNVFGDYRTDLINNIIPDVEAKFRAHQNPQQRAFAGLSMGGFLARDLLLNAPWEFGYIGIWSAGGLTTENLEPNLMDIWKMRGIDISVGGRDFLFNAAVDSMAALDEYGIPYTGLVTPGDCHTWYFWRDALYHFLTIEPLFKTH